MRKSGYTKTRSKSQAKPSHRSEKQTDANTRVYNKYARVNKLLKLLSIHTFGENIKEVRRGYVKTHCVARKHLGKNRRQWAINQKKNPFWSPSKIVKDAFLTLSKKKSWHLLTKQIFSRIASIRVQFIFLEKICNFVKGPALEAVDNRKKCPFDI